MAARPGARQLPTLAVEILTEVSGIAAAPGGPAERAEALLAQVRRAVPFDAGWITVLTPDRQSHVPLARSGYDERVCRHLDGPSVLQDAELVGLNRSRRPIRGRDMLFPPSEVPSWAEYVQPAGFRDGVSAGLFTPEGHFLGLLALHTRAVDQVSDAARDLLGALTAPIATALDPLRSLATIAGMVHEAIAGVVLTRSGSVFPLPGLPAHQLLGAGSWALAVGAAQLAQGSPHASFLAPLPNPVGAEAHVRITVLASPPDLQPFAVMVLLVSPAGDRHGLSPRELEVLGLLVTGASNERIAVVLGITARTVEAHVDHVRAKLAVPSRTAAAARALRLGLFVPGPLDHRPGVHGGAADPAGRPAP